MKRIRNRKFLKAKRVQYSLLLRVYRMSMQEFFQTASELKDEAEFEARVAAKLALYNASTMDWMSNVISPACWETCRGRRFCEGKLSCAEATLAAARLAVEEEMGC